MTPFPEPPPLVELIGAGKTYGGSLFRRNTAPVLQALDLALRGDRPPVIAVVGESGSGKTTLGNILLGLVAPDTGTLRFDGRDVRSFDRAERRQFRSNVQAITQDPFSAYNPRLFNADCAERLSLLSNTSN